MRLMNFFRSFSWLAFGVLATACSITQPAGDLSVELQLLAEETAGDDVPGVLIYLDRPDEPLTTVAGLSDRSAQTPMDGAATLRLGSITKLYVAALSIELSQAGLLDLDAPISTYLGDEVLAHLPRSLDPSVRQLLNHTSGIPDYYSERFYTEDWDRSEPLTPVLALHAIRGLPSTIKPGERFDYSNTNYHVLALILEKVSGKTMDELLGESIFTPLSLNETFYSAISPPGDTIHGYGSPFDPWEDTFEFLENSGPDGGMFATASDVAVWIRALFSKDGAFTRIGRAMTAHPVQEIARKAQGLGVEMLTSRSGETIYGHTGAIDGYLSAAFYIPSADAVLVIHINRSEEQAFSKLLGQALRLILADAASS